MKYRLSRNSTGSDRMMLNYLRANPSKVEVYIPFLKDMFEKSIRSSSNHQVSGDLAYLVLDFLDKNPSQIEANKSMVEGIVFGVLNSPNLYLKLKNTLGDFLTKHHDKCDFYKLKC